ncbi:hypothetical protein [Bacillus bombysepticus]|uniref:hypothetical protein n=1 Tax=Bacillus bombysepticus TaxID=658666 RepID=UPI003018413A
MMLFQHFLSIQQADSYLKKCSWVGLIDPTGVDVPWFVDWLKSNTIKGIVLMPFQAYEEESQQKKWIIAIPSTLVGWEMVRKKVREIEEDMIPLFKTEEKVEWLKQGIRIICSTTIRYEMKSEWIVACETLTENKAIQGSFQPSDRELRGILSADKTDRDVMWAEFKENKHGNNAVYEELEKYAADLEWNMSAPDKCHYYYSKGNVKESSNEEVTN